MESFVRNFIRSSLIWLAVAGLLGLSMALWPVDHLVYKPAHAHAALVGFVTMMIFGVAYHVMPRFTGNPLESRPMAALHLWVHNVGLTLMVSGWLVRPTWFRPGNLSLQIGGTVMAVGLGMFIYNLWSTLKEPEAAKRARKAVLGTPGSEGSSGAGSSGAPLPMAACPTPSERDS